MISYFGVNKTAQETKFTMKYLNTNHIRNGEPSQLSSGAGRAEPLQNRFASYKNIQKYMTMM